MHKNNLDYASLRMYHNTSVLGVNYYSFRDQHGQEVLVRSGDQFRSLLRTIRVAQHNQGAHYEAQ
jgi:diphthamide synthase subunit DPH2